MPATPKTEVERENKIKFRKTEKGMKIIHEVS